MTAILGIAGWLLFLGTALMFRSSMVANARDVNSLAMYSLALLFSDEFRTSSRLGVDLVIENDPPRQHLGATEFVLWLMQGITQSARSGYPNTIKPILKGMEEQAKETEQLLDAVFR
jgi:hypothetical protein